MLFLHIFNLQLDKFAIALPHVQGISRCQCMHMHLYNIIILHTDNGITNACQRITQRILSEIFHTALRQANDEFRTITEFLTFHGCLNTLACFASFLFLNYSSLHCRKEAFKNRHKTGTAAVHDTDFLQDRQQLRCTNQRFLGFLHHLLHYLRYRYILCRGCIGIRIISRLTHNGQNRSLNRTHNRLIRNT